MASHCETSRFIPAPRHLLQLISREAWDPGPPRRTARWPRWARAPGASHCGTRVPPGLLEGPPCSPGGAAEQLSPRTRAGRCISARPRRVYRDVERGLQETVWQAGPRQMDCQLISMYL